MCDRERNIKKIMNMDVIKFSKWIDDSMKAIDKEFNDVGNDTILLVKEVKKIMNELEDKK